jgi:hypothetical protein
MSSKKIKRKPRNKIMKTKPDLSIPISIELLGGDDDPCFGKYFDPRASECQRCGDSEICAIAMGQRNHVLRDSIESKKSFKDLEELDIPKPTDLKVIRKSIRNRVREMVKMGGGKYVDIFIIIDDIFASYSKDGFTKGKIKKMIIRMVDNSSKISINKNKLKWQSTK